MCSCARSQVGSCLLHRRSGEFSLFKLAIAPVFFVRRFKMKYAVFALVLAATAFVFSPASAMMMSCSGADMSKMTTMLAGMPDGPHKWEMNKHLAIINAAMAKDGIRGCNMTMKKMKMMMEGSKMSMMKSGM